MHKKWFRIVFRQRVFVILLLLLQVCLMVFTVYSSSRTYKWIHYFLYVVSIVVVLHIISTSQKPSYKLIWSVTILLFPLFGGLLYIFIRLQTLSPGFRRFFSEAEKRTLPLFKQDEKTDRALQDAAPAYKTLAHYLIKTCRLCAYPNRHVEFLSPGEEKFARMLEALRGAKRFIFLEYFIISEGEMWSAILEILKDKAAAGVDVRLIYDDLGCFMKLPIDFQKQMEAYGIKCRIFNKFRPALSTLQNNRDHRKIAVIDGEWAFTGGINIGDEYINKASLLGHWKDASLLLGGEAVNSFTLMFLIMWQALTGKQEEASPFLTAPKDAPAEDGFVIPYCDNPIDDEYVGEQVYMNMITGARQYLYIETPYLILDDSVTAALILAAKSGVDVRIITPHSPDKWYVHMTTRSYYRDLIRGGVKIYEYTPGFIHSKVMVADDMVAVVGSINLDFRRLYLHFECGSLLLQTKAVLDIKEDFLNTLDGCEQVSEKACRVGFVKKVMQSVLRLLAPLM